MAYPHGPHECRNSAGRPLANADEAMSACSRVLKSGQKAYGSSALDPARSGELTPFTGVVDVFSLTPYHSPFSAVGKLASRETVALILPLTRRRPI